MQPASPLQPFLEIFQGPSEPFVQFVERLTATIEQQVPKPYVREQVLEQMAYTHGNERCTAAILSIPKKPGTLPSLHEMLQAVNAIPTRPLHIQKRTYPRATAVEMPNDTRRPQMPNPQKKSFRGSPDRQRFLCGKKGHWTNQCPLKDDLHQFKKERGSAIKERGGGGSHQGSQQRKNWTGNAGPPSMQTSIRWSEPRGKRTKEKGLITILFCLLNRL